MKSETLCPCGSSKLFADCCAIILDDHSKALTAQQLMRSRYTAYTLARNEYLKESWAAETRPEELDVEDSTIQWLGLDIEECKEGKEEDTEGTVTFTARFLSSGHHCKLHEQSRFIKHDNLWYYLDGKSDSSTVKTGRNEPCPCGSGKKYKKCCR
jgi:SEC-C motif domain protein